MVQLFIDGGGFMWPILFIFIVGFVFVGERLYHLIKGLATTEVFAGEVAGTIKSDGIDAGKKINVKMRLDQLPIYVLLHLTEHI